MEIVPAFETTNGPDDKVHIPSHHILRMGIMDRPIDC